MTHTTINKFKKVIEELHLINTWYLGHALRINPAKSVLLCVDIGSRAVNPDTLKIRIDTVPVECVNRAKTLRYYNIIVKLESHVNV